MLRGLLTRPSFYTCLIAIIVYCDNKALHGGYVYDDAGSVIKNVVVNGHVNWKEAFTRDYWGIDMKESQSHKSFRPITTLTLKANYVIAEKLGKDHWLFGDPDWTEAKYPPTYTFHIVNVLLHGIVTFLITEATKYCFLEYGDVYKKRRKPNNGFQVITVLQFLVGFLFGIHPVHSEVVSNITSRGELLMSMFTLLGFLSYANNVQQLYDNSASGGSGDDDKKDVEDAKPSKGPSLVQYLIGVYIIPWVCMTLSLFSKEQGATTLITLIAWDIIQHYDSMKNLVKSITSTSVIMNPNDANTRSLAFGMIRRIVILAIQTLLVVGWRYILNGETSPDFIEAQNPAGFASDRFTRAFSVTWVYCLYIRDAIYPKYLSPDWSGVSIDLITNISDPRALCVIILWYFSGMSLWDVLVGSSEDGAAAAAGGGGEESSKASKKDDSSKKGGQFFDLDTITKRKINMFIWAFTFSPFLLSSNILVVPGLMKADRVIYLPLFGFCLLEALLLSKVFFKGNVTMGFGISDLREAAFWIGYFLVMFQLWLCCGWTHQRNLAWSNSLDLWEHAYLINPRSHHTMYNYGYELSIRQRYEEAAVVLEPIGSPRVDGPSNTFVYTMVLFNLGRCDEANVLLDDSFRVLDEKKAEGGPRNTDSALGRTRSNLLVARAHCTENINERGSILYDAVQADPTNEYAVQIATGLMEKLQQMEDMKKQYASG